MDFLWKSVIRRKATRGHQTPGNTKSPGCRADTKDRTFAKRSRAYKMRGFDDWCKKCDLVLGIRR